MASSELGDRQRGALKCLLRMGPYPGSGWVYGSRSQTITILESLIHRGLVEKVQASYDRWQLTDDGRLLAEKFAGRRQS